MSERPAHTLEERLAATNNLSPAEQRVARFFIDSSEQVTFLPAAKIAATLGVSNATVVRTAQRLGYTGLPELKEELREAMLRDRVSPTDRVRRSLDEFGGDPGVLPEQMLAVAARLLGEAGRALRPDDFDRAVGLLGDADRVVVYGQPPYGALADYFAQQLRRFGRRVALIGARFGSTAEELLDVGRGDALMVILYQSVGDTTAVVLELARERGLPCVVLTDTLALAVKDYYEVALTAPRGDVDMIPTATVPLAILETLALGVAGRDRARSLAAITSRDELVKRFHQPRSDR